MKRKFFVLIFGLVSITVLVAQESISLQNIEIDNSTNTINEIRFQQQFQQKIIERMLEYPSFEYVHFLIPVGFPAEDIPKNADRIQFVTNVRVAEREMRVVIRRWIDGWWCEYFMVFTNSSKIEGLANSGYSCKSAEDAKKIWSRYRQNLKEFAGIDFDKNNTPILIKPLLHGKIFG